MILKISLTAKSRLILSLPIKNLQGLISTHKFSAYRILIIQLQQMKQIPQTEYHHKTPN